MAETLRLGVAGLGEAATEFLPTYSKHPFIRLAACADPRDIARERFKKDFNARGYRTLEEMCGDRELDAIYVSTNHEMHCEHVLMVAESRKHVIVEKPMALTLEECDKMIAACERSGVLLLGGHNHSYDPPIKKMRQIIKSGELGRLCMVNTWNYNDFMVRPYPAYHLKMSRGVVLNQGAHQVDIVRLLGGGMVRSVRAMAGLWDRSRPGEGAYVCYLEFEDGTPATLVYNGYGFLDTAEFYGWIGEGGSPRIPETNVLSRRNYLGLTEAERETVINEMKEKMRYGSLGLGEMAIATMPPGWEKGGRPRQGTLTRHQPFFGLTLVTCEKGDMRQSPDGIWIYGDEKREVPIGAGTNARQAEIEELYNAFVHGKPLIHDGKWGRATIEVCLAILQSAEERREVRLSRQVRLGD